ncbi:phage major capsid protein [Pseudomonas sp. Au-Pse12]|uniref:phage major capsid protein n=1 Tax=Pseudomonas sp. Au-Pse12 TaxID=2906459 RepID=UPI001E43F080|nr:phage major capsid protein [Pseudomonas sp. Au-Pse12]MCE4058450.1 phage major capsid protein [Pseudomonas sp. Au-Pse12]
MPVDSQDVQQVAEALGARFDEFKKLNDQRLDGIVQEKGKLAEQVEKLNGQLTELERNKTELETELKSQRRPGGGPPVSKVLAEHKTAFGMFVRKGLEDGLRDLERKALNTATDEDGGFAVPEDLDRALIELARETSVMRQECNGITLGGTGYKKLVNLGGATSGWVGESDPRPATGTPKLKEVKPTWGEIYANPQATQGMLDDSFFDVEKWLSGDVNIEFSEQEEAGFSYGDGVNKPKGLFAFPTDDKDDKTRDYGKLQHMLASGAKLNADELMALIYTLRKPYRSGAKWMMNGLSLMACRLLKNAEGDYLWRPGLAEGAPSILLGYGIAENEEMPDIAPGVQPISFGNYKRAYTIIDRIGTRVLRDPYTNKPYVGFYTTKRVGAMLENSQAVKMLKMGAA